MNWVSETRTKYFNQRFEELQEDGMIPGSVNLPHSEIPQALELSRYICHSLRCTLTELSAKELNQGRFSPKVRISSAECRWPANNCDVQVFVKSSQTKREPTFKTRSGRRVGLAHAMLLERGFSHLNLYRYIHGAFFDCFLKVVSSCSSWEKLVSPSIYS